MAARKPPPQRLVLALDCDTGGGFYAQCETRRDPSLAGKPVGVRQKHLVITSNYAARAYGIRKGDSLAEVRRKCPQIVIKDGEDISHYTEVSNAWRAFVANFVGSRCPVEKSGLDELFVDVSAAVDAHGAGGAGEIGHVHGSAEIGTVAWRAVTNMYKLRLPRRSGDDARGRERGAALRPPAPGDEARAQFGDVCWRVDVEAAGEDGGGPPQALPADRARRYPRK